MNLQKGRVLLAAMTDGVAINQTNLQQVQTYRLQLLRVTCYLHTIKNFANILTFVS